MRVSSCSSAKSTGERLRSSCEKRTEKASSAGCARLGSCCDIGLRGSSGTSLMSEASMAISLARRPPLDQPAARTRTLSSSPFVASPRELLALKTTLSEPSSSAVAVSTDSMARDSALQTSGVSTPRASCTRCSSAVAASKAVGGGGGAGRVAESAGASELELLLLPNGHGGSLKGQSGNAEQVTALRRPVTAFAARSSVTAQRRLPVGVRQASRSAERMTTRWKSGVEPSARLPRDRRRDGGG